MVFACVCFSLLCFAAVAGGVAGVLTGELGAFGRDAGRWDGCTLCGFLFAPPEAASGSENTFARRFVIAEVISDGGFLAGSANAGPVELDIVAEFPCEGELAAGPLPMAAPSIEAGLGL